MSENKHTPEPWRVRKMGDDCFITAAIEPGMAYGPEIMGDDYTGYGGEGRRKADARRIVACVNACAGISTENLEDNVPVLELARRYNAVIKQRNDILAALEKMNRAYVNLMENGRDRIIDLCGKCDPLDVMERSDPNLKESRAVIASVKGGAA